ncbi:hypothetical protein ACUN7V_09645 [Quadrisphaera oryzae]|uniref:hypothetical protein n=1 Tax=Quadrisphaera TaxID=317661 RepID=UPI001646FEFD|nr:hypothetical protein [Quadrisphaera sp. RL12-1S]MBC3760746.1 hypothetical protein [Quadrisphaera sp. RL12-1S]
MAQVVGFSTPLLPYQAPPVVMAMGLARIPFRAAVSVSLSLAIVTAVVLVPLDYLWFGLLAKL